MRYKPVSPLKQIGSTIFYVSTEISAGLPHISNPFLKLQVFYFPSKVTLFLVLGVGTLTLSLSILGGI
jgi:hypothetical protein